MNRGFEITEKDRAIVRELLAACKIPRDRLPYTTEFDALREAFRLRTGKGLLQSDFWKLISGVAKQGGFRRRR